MSQLTVGSLFSGSGGFELGATILGMKAVWASEVEPFPILVTKKNFPDLVHLGDINNIKGGNIKPVDIITFGSPCQDLSIAGQRDGLSGSKSNLFYEAIRVIKEMRENTNEKYPRIIIWEKKTLDKYLNKSQKSNVKTYQFLNLQNGKMQGALWEENLVLHGESWMHNISESPKDVRESFLSQILQEKVQEKYYLTKKACQGILNRAQIRNKKLPELLENALKYQSTV